MKSIITLFALAAVAVSLGASPALAKPGKGKGKGNPNTHEKSKGPPGKKPGKKSVPPGQAKKHPGKKEPGPVIKPGQGKARVGFRDREREELRIHFAKYKRHPHGLPPGLARNLARGKPLPPGWQKKLHEGWIIDNAWWSHFHAVPSTYLPPGLGQPRDTGIYLFGDRLVRVHQPRREVIDVIHIDSIQPGR